MKKFLNTIINYTVEFSGSLTASVVVFISIIVWVLGGLSFGYGDSYQLVANTVSTLVTTMLCVLIQHSQDKDAKAVQIKLDTLIDAVEKADNKYIDIENSSEEELREALDFKKQRRIPS